MLGKLIFVEMMVSEGIPTGIRDQIIILVPIVAKMGRETGANFFTKPIFDHRPLAWKITVAKCPQLNLSGNFFSKHCIPAFAWRGEDNPMHFYVANLCDDLQKGAAATHFNVVAVRAETENASESWVQRKEH